MLVAQADTFTQLTNVTQITGTPDTVVWSSIGTDDTPVVSGVTSATTIGGKTIGISFSDSGSGLVYVQGSSTTGWFGGGTTIGWTNQYLLGTDDTSPATPDRLTLTFSTPVSEFGALIEAWAYSQPFVASIVDINGSASSISVSSTSAPMFLGVDDTSGANITSLTFDVTGSGSDHDFALGPGTMVFGAGSPPPNGPSAPEPASLLLMGSGIAALLWKARKRFSA